MGRVCWTCRLRVAGSSLGGGSGIRAYAVLLIGWPGDILSLRLHVLRSCGTARVASPAGSTVFGKTPMGSLRVTVPTMSWITPDLGLLTTVAMLRAGVRGREGCRSRPGLWQRRGLRLVLRRIRFCGTRSNVYPRTCRTKSKVICRRRRIGERLAGAWGWRSTLGTRLAAITVVASASRPSPTTPRRSLLLFPRGARPSGVIPRRRSALPSPVFRGAVPRRMWTHSRHRACRSARMKVSHRSQTGCWGRAGR